jgi:hypothetical protein
MIRRLGNNIGLSSPTVLRFGKLNDSEDKNLAWENMKENI